MAIISAILSLLSRKLGDLLQALFGWSITGLFGRLPSRKQTALSVALILSLAWPVLLVGTVFPKVAAWALAFLPLQKWLGKAVLRALWIVLAILAPVAVGLITNWVAPSERQHGGALKMVLYGVPLSAGFAISFLITFFVVPALKIVATIKGWEDEHVYVQVKGDSYRAVLAALAQACTRAGIPVREEPAPAVMQLPVMVLKWFSRGALAPVVPENPRRLCHAQVAAYLYPADLLLRGEADMVARIRSALVRELLPAPAYLVADPRAQRIQDEIDRLWGVVKRHLGPEELGDRVRGWVRQLARKLDDSGVPYDDWMILYSDLHHLEREVCGGPRLVDPEPLAEAADTPALDPPPGRSILQIIKERFA